MTLRLRGYPEGRSTPASQLPAVVPGRPGLVSELGTDGLVWHGVFIPFYLCHTSPFLLSESAGGGP